MNTRAPTSALPSVLGAPVGATGGLYAFALSLLGYAYFYFCFYLLTAGGL